MAELKKGEGSIRGRTQLQKGGILQRLAAKTINGTVYPSASGGAFWAGARVCIYGGLRKELTLSVLWYN